jgi:broad specificity phosphatase PhoE
MTGTRAASIPRPFCAAAIAVLVLVRPASAVSDDSAGWVALSEPGTIAILRHAHAPGVGDPPNFALDDCATQRNLSDEGRAQARALGDAFRAHGIRQAKVYSSPWCRCLETARLLDLGPVEPLDALSNLYGHPERTEPQMKELRAFLKEIAPSVATTKVILVTHNVVIAALVGESTGSADVVVLKLANDGTPTVAGRIHPPR